MITYYSLFNQPAFIFQQLSNRKRQIKDFGDFTLVFPGKNAMFT